MKGIRRTSCIGEKGRRGKKLPVTFSNIPMKDRQGANAGGKTCLYNGPTRLSSIVIIPLVLRNG